MIGCVSPFSQFYYDCTERRDITKIPTVIVSQNEPVLIRGNNVEDDFFQMLEDGYNPVGYSLFNSGNVNENGAIAQAKKVHASVVILYSEYTGTVSGTIPLILPDTKRSTTLFSGSANGSAGYATYSGSAYKTTYGSKTTYIPYSVRPFPGVGNSGI